jgi:hypothetical protein
VRLFRLYPLSAQVPPGTGASGPFNDQNFKIVTETLSRQHSESNRAPAWIVKKRAGWAPELAGTQWIAPDPDHSISFGNHRNFGSVTYQTQFMATPALMLNTRVLADDNVVVSLNGAVVFTSAAAQHFSAAMFQISGFVSGMNTVTFAVSNDGGRPNGLDVAFSDAGAPPSGPALAFNHSAAPDAMAFAPTAVGATSALTLSVTNNGDSTATFAAIEPPTGSFSIDPGSQRCGAPLDPGASCTFNVVFAPASVSPSSQAGSLRISLQGGANPSTYTVNLSGTAAALPSAGLPSLTYSPASLVFPATPVNGASAEQLVKITNCAGCSPAIFSDFYVPPHFTVNFTPSAAFAAPNGPPPCSQKTDDPTQFLGDGLSCVVGFTFHPTATAAVTENFGIDLMCDVPCQGVVFNVHLTGSGGTGPVLIFTPNPVVFPDSPAGTASAPVNVTVKNIGDPGKFSNLPTDAIFKVAGYECVGLPAQTIAHNGTCAMPSTFNPPTTTLAGTIMIADPLAATPNPLKIGMAAIPSAGEIIFPLSAIGKVSAAPVDGPAVTFSPALPMSFRAPVFENSQGQTLTITNSGTKPLVITSYTFGTGNAFGYSSECIGTIQAGDHCKQDIVFHPSTIGTSTDAFVIHDNATPPDQTVSLTGVGLGPVVSLDNTTLKMLAPFGGQSPIATVTLKNIGTADLYISNVGAPAAGTGFVKKNDTCIGATIPMQGGLATSISPSYPRTPCAGKPPSISPIPRSPVPRPSSSWAASPDRISSLRPAATSHFPAASISRSARTSP